ncbi:MAG: hypothetical protein KIS86_02965 [Devosia sp.]|nr:hypothetical protein [Devosia sp.]
MITVDDLDRMLALMGEHGLQMLDVREGETRVRIVLGRGPPEPVKMSVKTIIKTEAIGTFVPTHPRLAVPMVAVGDKVMEREIVGFLASGAVLMPIRASASGHVTSIHARPGELLGFGAPVLSLA